MSTKSVFYNFDLGGAATQQSPPHTAVGYTPVLTWCMYNLKTNNTPIINGQNLRIVADRMVKCNGPVGQFPVNLQIIQCQISKL